jgi:hypothetical protein
MSKPKTTSGGGQYKEPVIEEARRVFGTNSFTYAEVHHFVSGYNRPIHADLINSGDVKRVPTPRGYIHHSLVSGDVRFYTTSLGLYKFKREDPANDVWTYDVEFEEL